AVEVLSKASLILAEDTRTSATLMKHFGITTPMISHHKYNEHSAVGQLIERLKAGEVIALVSDAGTPGVSDPGFMLSRECGRADIDVETLPGATAFVPALVSSGLPCDRFVFEGFLPPKKGRATRLAALAEDQRTFIIYESPLRVAKTLEQLAEVCGSDRPASVSREISKIYETTVRGTLAELVEFFKMNQARGEIVIVVGGKQVSSEEKIHKNKYKD
ncbi:MAG: 16S rRNA (cytidine(1402)-2'-O)-methyltransferase, partial [Muribaculaceae bacterium]|nr:16S rRNA (cytidine(1402)-2'-O)-methyltransferase [Muribaculaceae bacterium]